MKVVFVIYHDIMDDRINKILQTLQIDYYTEWENVKGKGHSTDAHLGSRTFPGYNTVRMIAFKEEQLLTELLLQLSELNKEIIREDDRVRLFQLPLEKLL